MTLSLPAFDYIRALVQKRSAMVLDQEKAYLVEARLCNLARLEGYPSADELVAQLRAGPEDGLHCKVVEAMTINETSFFRDIHPFESLRQVVIPDLVQRRRIERSLNFWCAACSSGQEPYSLAMLLRQHFHELSGWNTRVLARDISTDMVARARQGVYSQLEVNRGLTPHFLGKFFDKQGTDWRIKDEVRRLVEFRSLNLIGAWPVLPSMDVILLRNVLIYFDVPTKKLILARLRQLLRPDGYLFLGGAETTLNLDDAFERVQLDRFSCYRLRSGAPPDNRPDPRMSCPSCPSTG